MRILEQHLLRPADNNCVGRMMKQAALIVLLALGLMLPLRLWAGPEDAPYQQPIAQYVIVGPDGWNVKGLTSSTYKEAAEATQISFPSVWTNPGAGAVGMSAEFSF